MLSAAASSASPKAYGCPAYHHVLSWGIISHHKTIRFVLVFQGLPLGRKGDLRPNGVLNVDLVDKLGVLLDILEAQLRLFPHQLLDQLRGLAGLGDVFVGMPRRYGDAKQGPGLRIHGRFLQLPGRHFAQALEAADVDFGAAGELFFQQFVLVGIILGIDRLGPLGDPV